MNLLRQQALLMAQSGGNDPYIAFRRTIANLMVDLYDPLRVWTPRNGAAVAGGKLVLTGTEYIDTPQDTALDLGNSDFCLEAYLEATGGSGERGVFTKWGAALSYFVGINGSANLTYYYVNSGGLNFPFNGPLPAGEHHVAWYRLSGVVFISVDGIPTSLGSRPSIDTVSYPTAIGATAANNGQFVGTIRGARITIGSTGGYTGAAFTPPTLPLPVS
jgi:hypothetical protein